MPTFTFFADDGLTVPLASLPASIPTGGGTAEGMVRIGSPSAAAVLTKSGGGNVMLSVFDTDGAGGIPASAVKLALTYAGLASATGGAALSLGETLLGGAANRVTVFWRVTLAAGAAAVHNDLRLRLADIIEA